MIWIIAGGRDHQWRTADFLWLDQLEAEIGPPSEVIHGGASGADSMAHRWALGYRFSIKTFPADWENHGKSAGPRRNRAMAAYVRDHGGGVCILFPGGRGTASMKAEARAAGLKIIERGE